MMAISVRSAIVLDPDALVIDHADYAGVQERDEYKRNDQATEEAQPGTALWSRPFDHVRPPYPTEEPRLYGVTLALITSY
jgi:hypothetical protein